MTMAEMTPAVSPPAVLVSCLVTSTATSLGMTAGGVELPPLETKVSPQVGVDWDARWAKPLKKLCPASPRLSVFFFSHCEPQKFTPAGPAAAAVVSPMTKNPLEGKGTTPVVPSPFTHSPFTRNGWGLMLKDAATDP